MAIDQHCRAEVAVRAGDQPAQRAVVGLVQPLDTGQRFVDRNALIVDLVGVSDNARDRSQSAGHPHRPGIGE